MGDKGEGGVKNLKKMGDIIYGQPLWVPSQIVHKINNWIFSAVLAQLN